MSTNDGEAKRAQHQRALLLQRPLEALAKHFGLVTERLEMSGWDKISARLNHARSVGPTAST